MFGDKGLQEVGYAAIEKTRTDSFKARGAWLGITDKYWAAALIPDQTVETDSSFKFFQQGTTKSFQTDYPRALRDRRPRRHRSRPTTRLFAGAKEVTRHGRLRRWPEDRPLRPA